MTALTPIQRETLAYIVETIADCGRPPTVREMCARFGVSGTNAISDRLRGLERKGVIHMSDGASRSIRVVGVRWRPVVESDVSADVLTVLAEARTA